MEKNRCITGPIFGKAFRICNLMFSVRKQFDKVWMPAWFEMYKSFIPWFALRVATAMWNCASLETSASLPLLWSVQDVSPGSWLCNWYLRDLLLQTSGPRATSVTCVTSVTSVSVRHAHAGATVLVAPIQRQPAVHRACVLPGHGPPPPARYAPTRPHDACAAVLWASMCSCSAHCCCVAGPCGLTQQPSAALRHPRRPLRAHIEHVPLLPLLLLCRVALLRHGLQHACLTVVRLGRQRCAAGLPPCLNLARCSAIHRPAVWVACLTARHLLLAAWHTLLTARHLLLAAWHSLHKQDPLVALPPTCG